MQALTSLPLAQIRHAFFDGCIRRGTQMTRQYRPQCPSQVCAVSQSRNCKSLPRIPPRSRKRCKHRHRNRPHTSSSRWILSIRVDEDLRAPSDWQLRHWQACAPWQSRPLPRCLYGTHSPSEHGASHKQRTGQHHPRHHRHCQGLQPHIGSVRPNCSAVLL